MQRLAFTTLAAALIACGPPPRDGGRTCSDGETTACECSDASSGGATCSGGSFGACVCETECTAGATQGCTCEGGASGERACTDAATWGACECPSSDCDEGDQRICGCPQGLLGFETCDASAIWSTCDCSLFAAPKLCVLDAAGEVDASTCTRLDETPPFFPTIDFGVVTVGSMTTRTVRVINEGTGPMRTTTARAVPANAGFAPPAVTTSEIQPGAWSDFAWTFTAAEPRVVTATALVLTHDAALPAFELPLKADVRGPKICFSAPAVDFGAVAIGSTATREVNVTNCGSVPLELEQVSFAASHPALTVGTLPAEPAPLAPGAAFTIVLSFSPGDVMAVSGTITVLASGTTSLVPVTGRGLDVSCASTGPVAAIVVKEGSRDITPNPTAPPQSTLMLEASASVVPNGGPTYEWKLVSQPAGGTQQLGVSAPERRQLFLALAGTYVVELVVTDQLGCRSAPATATIEAKITGVMVQLTWLEAHSDLDLHWVGPGGTVFHEGSFLTSASDCFYATCKEGSAYFNADWGKNGTTDADGLASNNPVLTVDALWGKGPEVIKHAQLFDGTFTAYVNHYCSRQSANTTSFGTATAVLSVWVDGVEKLSVQQVLSQRNLWKAATVTVSGSTVTVTPEASVSLSPQDEACSPATD